MRDADAPGALRTEAMIGGREASWSKYAIATHRSWQDSHSGRASARRATTPEDMLALFDDLAAFARAGLATTYSPGSNPASA